MTNQHVFQFVIQQLIALVKKDTVNRSNHNQNDGQKRQCCNTNKISL